MAELPQRRLQPGEHLFSEGDAADCAYVIEDGEIEVLATQAGITRCVAVVGPGNLLGEMAMLDDAPRSATARARTGVRLSVIERRQLASRLQGADPVLRLLLNVLLNRMRNTLQGSVSSNFVSDWQAPDQQTVLERIKLENELKAALGAGEIQVWLQPIAGMNTRVVRGFESLVRWQHPTRGMVRPDHFISVAEESGIIVPLGRFILREACRLALLLDAQPNRAGVQGQGAFISVNVSTGQFEDPEFLPVLADILRETGLPPRRLKLEITESVLGDADAARAWIDAVKALGVRVALDDFGTGYSSLSYLHAFSIDTLKIDQSFVRRLLHDPRSEQIVLAIIKLSHALGLEIIAEGVETEDHFQKLAGMGCQYAQGYLIERPQPIAHWLNLGS